MWWILSLFLKFLWQFWHNFWNFCKQSQNLKFCNQFWDCSWKILQSIGIILEVVATNCQNSKFCNEFWNNLWHFCKNFQNQNFRMNFDIIFENANMLAFFWSFCKKLWKFEILQKVLILIFAKMIASNFDHVFWHFFFFSLRNLNFFLKNVASFFVVQILTFKFFSSYIYVGTCSFIISTPTSHVTYDFKLL